MQSHYLKKLFEPSSIAVIGASNRHNSVGMKVFKNLLQGNFSGKLYAVNPKHSKVQGRLCFSSIKKIIDPIDLAVITAPAKVIPDIIKECGEKGVRVAVVISSGFSEIGKQGKVLEEKILTIAKHYQIRLLGPNCLGIARPVIGMNATFDNNVAQSGHIALVSQSGALNAGILDRAVSRGIGFSAIVSLGNGADINFGEVLDYLASDPKTKSILLYIEGIHNSRHFMSGLRAAARIKPVIAIKAGRNLQGIRAALSHTGALIGSDDVFDVALRRAGVVRVITIEELFSAAEILANNYQLSGDRLVIITNGGGAGVMAADCASSQNINLVQLDKEQISQLNKILPIQWSHQNPVDVIGDATPERYHAVIDFFAKDKNINGILIILVPVSMAHPLQVAKQIIQDAKKSNKILLACWMGEKQVQTSWKLFAKHKIPFFDTPEKAVQAFSYLAEYYHNQQLLLQTPESLAPQPNPDIKVAKTIIEAVLAEKRTVLTAVETKNILQAFAIPVTSTIQAASREEALSVAEKLGFPVVLKINSPDISHKQDVDGVVLNINDAKSVLTTFDKLIKNAKAACPKAKILGVTVEPMIKSVHGRELMIGVMHDVVFGPVISFGAGGALVEVMRDIALELPPLNRNLAERLIARTKIAKMLTKFRNMPAVKLELIINVLLRISEMVCELSCLQELDINPLIIDEKGIVAVDARMVINNACSSAN